MVWLEKSEADEATTGETGARMPLRVLLAQAASMLKWEPVESLQRLPGFIDPFERCIHRGLSALPEESVYFPVLYLKYSHHEVPEP